MILLDVLRRIVKEIELKFLNSVFIIQSQSMDIIQFFCNPPPYAITDPWYKRPIIRCWNRTLCRSVPKMCIVDCYVMILYLLPASLIATVGAFLFALTFTGVHLGSIASSMFLVIPCVFAVIGAVPLMIPNCSTTVVKVLKCTLTGIIWLVGLVFALPVLPFLFVTVGSCALSIVGFSLLLLGGWLVFWGIYSCFVLWVLKYKESSVFNEEVAPGGV